MKKGEKVKRVLVSLTYLLLSVVCIIGIYILISMTSNKQNDRIAYAQDSSTYLRNVNPKFLIDFVNNEYIRFETVSSYSNPFENKKQSIWDKIKYMLGIGQEKKGIEISLMEVSYDTDLSQILDERDIDISQQPLSKSFELTSTGREIGSDSDDPISKDTVISKNIYKGVDIEYQIMPGKGLKEEIVLNELPEFSTDCEEGVCSLPVNRFLFKIALDEGLSIKKSFDGQNSTSTYYVVDTQNNYYAHFLPEFAVDSVGYKTSNVVSNISLTDSGEYMYEIILDPEWLLSKERVFPIRIDPSIIHDSELVFNEGIYDRVLLDQALTLSLNSNEYRSGTYTSSVLDLGENSILNSISWQGYAQATGDGEIPFSTLGLIYENNFNDLVSSKKKWGSGALQLNIGDSKTLEIDSNQSEYTTLEFWSYKRNIGNDQRIFTSNIGELSIAEGKYAFKDLFGVLYSTEIPIKYNVWQHIALVSNISNSRLTIYIDESEYQVDVGYSNQLKLDTLTFQGVGYIDTVRIYERLLAKNELLSNTQYSKLSLQYMTSFDNVEWSEWLSKSKYIPTPVVGDGYMDISSSEENIGNFDTLSFQFLSDSESSLILGTSKFSNGVDEEDIIRLDQAQGPIEVVQPVRYIDLVFTPTTNQNSCLLSLGGLEIYSLDTGEVGISLGGSDISIQDMYIPKEENFLSLSFTDTQTVMYLNGNILQSDSPFELLPTQYSVGSGCTDSLNAFGGEVKDTRISVNQKDQTEILKYHNISGRRYLLKPMFKANLQNDTQIADINDTKFSIY